MTKFNFSNELRNYEQRRRAERMDAIIARVAVVTLVCLLAYNLIGRFA